MSPTEAFIYDHEDPQREILLYVHELFLTFPGILSKIRYRVPFYYHKSWICYLNPIKENGIELAFIRANELSNVQGLLDFRGRKQVAGIRLFDLADIPEAAIREIFQEALLLDQTVPYASKRKKKRR